MKTDAIDAYALCELFYKEDFEHYKTRGLQLLNLRNLTRQHEAVTGLHIQIKLQFQAVLDQVFPEYKGVFGELHSVVSLKLLLEFPTAESVIIAGKSKLAERITCLCTRRSDSWAEKKAETLFATVDRNPFRKAPFKPSNRPRNVYQYATSLPRASKRPGKAVAQCLRKNRSRMLCSTTFLKK